MVSLLFQNRSIGNASTNPIPSAARSGYPTFNPIHLNIYNPISTCIKDINISKASAFK